MLKLLILFLFLLPFAVPQCPPQSSQFRSDCKTYALFMLDTTNYVTASDITQEYNFTWNLVLPYLSFPAQQHVSFVSFGSGETSFPMTTDSSTACHQLYDVYQQGLANGGKTETVLKMIQHLYSNYLDYIGTSLSVVLFSASTDAVDILAASKFVKSSMSSVSFSVVALSGNTSIWEPFPANSIYSVTPANLNGGSPLATCLLCDSCRQCNHCTGSVSTTQQTTTPVQTTQPPTTTTPTTTTTRVTSPPSTPKPSTNSSVNGPRCNCNRETVWTDIMVLIDSSSSSGPRGIADLLGYVQTTFAWYNLQKSSSTSQFHSRMGIISYADNVTTVASLGSLDNNGLASVTDIPYPDQPGTNIEGAIQQAVLEFDTSNHRTNARKVILLLATSYSNGGYHAPKMVANAFKGDNGILIVYNYIQEHGLSSDTLEELASPGYFLTNEQDTDGTKLQTLMCDANCFCPPNYDSFMKDPATHSPTAGCYYATTIMQNYQVANNDCSKFNNGYLAQGKTLEKTEFLESEFFTASNYWAGFIWDSLLHKYLWIDGTQVSGEYQPWFGGSAHPSGKDCVYVIRTGSLLQWVHTDCRNGFQFVCEAPACDSTHYCTEEI